MKKKIMASAVVLSVLIIVVIFGAAWHFSSQLINPAPYTCQEDHFVYCDGPARLGVPWRDVNFQNDEGLSLKGWFFPKEGSRRGIVMVHGITADRREGLRWVKALNRGGFNVLVFDLRNHGQSEKAPTGMGLPERADAMAAVSYMMKEERCDRVGIFGVSMGGATAIQAMSADERISAGVFEASYAHVGDLLSEIASRDFGLPRFPIIPAVMRLFELRGGFNAGDINPEDRIGLISPRPVFIIHCSGDEYIHYRHAERLNRAAKEPKIFWTADCTMHARAWQSAPYLAEKKVVAFFRENLK